jgi:protein-S-isoprenylcysteine O-methyltransferase Ste14
LTLRAATDGVREMQDRRPDDMRPAWRKTPLARLLAINLAIGAVLALLLVGGLLLLNPGGLRDLIMADRSPLVALGLLLFGFIITLGSTAMGTAIMAMGDWDEDGPGGGLRTQEVTPRDQKRAAV